MQKSAEMKIDLNASDRPWTSELSRWNVSEGTWTKLTGFHYACISGKSKMIEMLIDMSSEFSFDLNAKVRQN